MEQPTITPGERNIDGLDIQRIRNDFPMLTQQLNGKQFIYFDSAATGLKPLIVLQRMHDFYTSRYGKPKEVDGFSKSTVEAIEETRSKVAEFIGAKQPKEIIFTKGCTEAINIVANGFAKAVLAPADEVIISQFEHHANIVPWQMACRLSGAILKVARIAPNDELDLNHLEHLITHRTKIISVCHSSHVLGTILPIKEITAIAHKRGIPVMADGAQVAPHMPVSMQNLDCDFYTIAAHKMGAPTGLGFLYGKENWLNKIVPLEGGGEMAKDVSFDSFSYADIPTKFEAGTTPFAQIIATGSLLEYLWQLNMEKSSQFEKKLLSYATEKLLRLERVNIFGRAVEKEPVVSFNVQGVDLKKLEAYLNTECGIVVRVGELAAQPLMKLLKVKDLLRASFCYYNTFDEVDTLIGAVEAFIKQHG